MFYIHGHNCSSEKGRLKVKTSCKGKVGLVRMGRKKKELMTQRHSSQAIQTGFLCYYSKDFFLLYRCVCKNWCKKVFVAKTGTDNSPLSKDYRNQWAFSLCSFPSFHTINPGVLSVVQRFSGNSRGQPCPA